jgi:hypothetical protein
MSTTNFAVSINNIATTVATNYTVPAAYPVVLGIASAAGISLSGSQWIRISTFRAGAPYSILKATAPVQTNGVGAVAVTTGGSGYTSAPTVSFSGGGGSGATATATIASGAVTAITVTASGSGYTSAPTVAFSGGGGTGAAATATVAAATVLIAGVVDGYTDQNLVVGDAAELRVTAGAFNDLSTAVNALESGATLQAKPTAIVATTAALAANTYANGTAGVGATLTATSNGALAAIDGYTPVLNDLILVKNESTASHNGLYTVTQVGDASHPYILTRSTAMDVSGEYQGAIIPIGPSGTTNGKTIWECTNTSAPTVGTTSITFAQVSGGGSLAIGSPITGGTAKSVLFVDASGNLGQDNAAFYWDDTPKSLWFSSATSGAIVNLNTTYTAGGNSHIVLNRANVGAECKIGFYGNAGGGSTSSYPSYRMGCTYNSADFNFYSYDGTTLRTHIKIDPSFNVKFNNTVTIDTNGYMSILTGSAAPTGTPATGALFLDTTNFKLYARCGSTWKSVTLS